jgi:hypothetical protein
MRRLPERLESCMIHRIVALAGGSDQGEFS